MTDIHEQLRALLDKVFDMDAHSTMRLFFLLFKLQYFP